MFFFIKNIFLFFTKLDFSKLKEYGPDARFCGARAPVSGRLCRRGGKFVGMRPLCGALPFVSGRLGRRGENLVRMCSSAGQTLSYLAVPAVSKGILS